MARFHGKLLGMARMATILACLGAASLAPALADPPASFSASSNGVATSSLTDPFEPNPFDNGRPLPEVPERFLQKNDWSFKDFLGRAVIQAYVRATADQVTLKPDTPDPSEGCFPGDNPLLAAARSASIFLLMTYSNGDWTQGTGTIVRGSGQGGPDRILTAAHVIEPILENEEKPLLEAIHAYDSDGRYLGVMRPVLRGERNVVSQHAALERKEGLPISVLNDLAVLEVQEFASDAVEKTWNDRGLPVAPSQSEYVQLLTERASDWVFNPGASGGAVLNAEGQIIGVSVYYGWAVKKSFVAPESGNLDRLAKADGDPDHFEDFFGRVKAYRDEKKNKSMKYGAAMIALPLRQIELRQALDLPDQPLDSGPSTQLGIVAAYPRQECTVAQVRAHDVPAWPAKQGFDAERLWQAAPAEISVAFAASAEDDSLDMR